MYTVATRLHRFLANLLDGVIAMSVSQILYYVLGQPFYLEIVQDASGNPFPIWELHWVSTGVSSIVWLGMALYFYARAQSPGKAIMKMQVVNKETGLPVGMGTMLFREIPAKLVSGIVLGLGYAAILWDKNHQGWHDKMASTVVVKRA